MWHLCNLKNDICYMSGNCSMNFKHSALISVIQKTESYFSPILQVRKLWSTKLKPHGISDSDSGIPAPFLSVVLE